MTSQYADFVFGADLTDVDPLLDRLIKLEEERQQRRIILIPSESYAPQPVRQALVSMTQTFIDTLVVCTMTGLVILLSGVWTSGATGAPLTALAFETGLPGSWGKFIVPFGLVLFAYSTILGWSYYGERSVEFLLGPRSIMPYRVIFCLFVLI